MVKIVIGNIYSKIVGFLPDPVQSDLNRTLSYKVANARHMPKVRAGVWDGKIRLYMKNKGQSFYTGLMAFVRDILKKHKIEYFIVDSRNRPEVNLPNLIFTPPSDFEEREYQNFTINRSLKFTRGILEMATGSGKTLVSTKLISEIKTYPFIFYVLTKDLMHQAHGVLSSCLNEPVGMIGDGKVDMKKISVCTIQTAIRAINANNKKFKIDDYVFDDEDTWDEKGIESSEKIEKIQKLIRMTKGIFFDECHHAASRTCKEVLSASPLAYWRFAGSATPYREDNAGIMIQAMFGSKIVNVSASYLIKNDFLVKPYIFIEPIESSADFHSYPKIYEHCVVKNNKFNDHVAQTAKHLVSRGLSTLVLVQQYPQGDYLKEIIPDSVFVTSRMTSKQRKDSLQDLRDKKIMCMIATSLADEGLDIPTLDSVIMAGGGKSVTRVNQRIGRTIRKNKASKKDKSIVVIYDHYKTRFLLRHTKKINTILKKEKEFEVLPSKGHDFICGEIDDLLKIKNNQGGLFE